MIKCPATGEQVISSYFIVTNVCHHSCPESSNRITMLSLMIKCPAAGEQVISSYFIITNVTTLVLVHSIKNGSHTSQTIQYIAIHIIPI